MTDLDLANLCAQIYASANNWTHYWNQDGIVCGHQIVDSVDYLVFRGSVTPEDWIRDMDAIPVWHPKLGFIHAGFALGLDALYAAIVPMMKGKSVVVTGHSLGAARACDIAGMFAYDASDTQFSCPVKTLVTFGQPKPAFANLSRIIQKSGMEHRSYRNRNDPVPLVPFPFPLPFCNTEDWISLDAAPLPSDLEPLRDHHISLYVQGLTPKPAS